MRTRLMQATRTALKAHDKQRVSALRLISAAIQERDIASHANIPDADIPAVLQRMIKQRREALAMYEKAGRTAQAQQEAGEIAVIEEFLPQQMGDDAVREAIDAAITEVGAVGSKDMGKVMAALKQRYGGRMDFANASARVKDLLKQT
jgi:uncharacterized protein YqeY